jgi:hypothetical protein
VAAVSAGLGPRGECSRASQRYKYGSRSKKRQRGPSGSGLSAADVSTAKSMPRTSRGRAFALLHAACGRRFCALRGRRCDNAFWLPQQPRPRRCMGAELWLTATAPQRRNTHADYARRRKPPPRAAALHARQQHSSGRCKRHRATHTVCAAGQGASDGPTALRTKPPQDVKSRARERER